MCRCSTIFLVLLISLVLPHVGQAQYAVSSISDELKAGADAVIRLKEGEFTIESIDRATYRVHSVVTVLNEDADRYGYVVTGYDKLTKVTEFNAVVYDASGKVIQKLKNKDIVDQSSISGFSLYEDNRLQYADLRQKEYPYTVDYTFQVDYKFLYGIPNWTAIPGEDVAVEKSTYTVSAPDNLKPRYKMLEGAPDPAISEEDGLSSYRWTFENLEAREEEGLGSGIPNNPKVLVGTSKFRYEGYEGDMSTWDDLAAWMMSLNEGRNDLSENAKNEVRKLTQGLGTEEEKVAAVYEYMQNRTRYVSIQLGIGGYQTFPASSVENNGYGDCKALSFYTKSLLESIDITSHYTLVSAGRSPQKLERDFPDNYFNHVILCVPNAGDTLWLECTNQNIPAGYIGSFTSDRDVLVITESGAKIAHTTTYEGEDYQYLTRGQIKIDKQGNAETTMQFDFVGQAVDDGGVWHMPEQDEKTQRDWVKSHINIPSYELSSFSFEKTPSRVPKVKSAMTLTTRSWASTSGKRLFLQPNIQNQRTDVPPSGERDTPIRLRNAYIERDTLDFVFPEGSFIDKLPATIEIESSFGKYRAQFESNEGQLRYIRTFQTNKGEWKPEAYEELVQFYKDVRRADRKKVVVSMST